MKKFWKQNSLSIVIFAIFFATITGMSVAGWHFENEERASHGQPSQSYGSYVVSGNFIEGVFENWESEFLQMWALVVLTVFLYQKGSDESKPLRGKSEKDTRSRYSLWRTRDLGDKTRALKHHLYSHSLGLALLGIFIVSFLLHAAGGTDAFNETARQHGQEEVSMIRYMITPQFWYESLQNWQSEFLAVGTLILLTIKLRERGSQESKPVGARYDNKTGV